MEKFLKKILKKIDSKYEEKEEIREKEKRLLKIRIAAYNLGTKSALKPKEVFWYITFPKILKFSRGYEIISVKYILSMIKVI